MRTGTCHFVSFDAAVAYYRDYGFAPDDVLGKLKAGEIHIGMPETKPGSKVILDQGEGRYFIGEGV